MDNIGNHIVRQGTHAHRLPSQVGEHCYKPPGLFIDVRTRGCTRGAAVFNLAILSRLISARRMGGELSKGKHGGDRASGVEYVSSGNKLIKKRKKEEEGGGEGEDGHRFRAEHTSFL